MKHKTNHKDGFLYEKLYKSLKEDIISGRLSPEDRLPSIRNLAKEKGISVTTIALAYNQLVVEGYVINRPCSGYYVCDLSNSGDIESLREKRNESTEGIKEDNPYIYDTKWFDFTKWKRCSSKVFTNYAHLLFFESDPLGEILLREEVAKYLSHFRGVQASWDRIVIGAGTQQITSHISRILKRMNIDLVSLEEPGYLPVQSMFLDGGFSVKHIPVSKDGIKINQLPENLSSCVYVSPSNQFPTGAVMPIAKRLELLEWAKKNRSIIIEDDYDSELRYFGKPVPAMQGLDKNDSVVYLGSFSSTLFPAVKISYMVLPKTMIKVFNQIKNQYTQTCSKAEQLTLALFMKEGYYYTGIRRLRTLYSRKLELVLQCLNNDEAKFITPVNTKSGITINLKIKSDKPNTKLCEEAKDLGLYMVPLSKITDQESSALSFYYSQLPLDKIEGLIDQLVSKWKN